jgi:Spy/CpxP family protein refolding chaperone
MKAKTLASAASIAAALSLTAVPIAAAASSTHHTRAPVQSRFDRSHDLKGKKHMDTSRDRTPDRSVDIRNR